MLVDKFKIAVLSLLVFGGIMLTIIAFQLNNISKQSNHRYMINSNDRVVLDTQTGNAYIIEIGSDKFLKVEMK